MIVGFVVATLVGAVIGASVALAAYRRGKLDIHDEVASPCPTCGSVEVLEFGGPHPNIRDDVEPRDVS